VSGENQKAHLPKPHTPKNDDAAGWSDLARSHAVADPKVFELESLLAYASPAKKTFTRNTADLFARQNSANRPSKSFHDLSATSVGLLTNVATGGWRKDLSLLTENWNSQPTSGLEFFQLTPANNATFTRPVNGPDYRLPGSLLYPVEVYFLIKGDDYIHPLCETQWRHDPRSRALVFVMPDKSRRAPRIFSFSDYRQEPEK
jgi:hypothetical protein